MTQRDEWCGDLGNDPAALLAAYDRPLAAVWTCSEFIYEASTLALIVLPLMGVSLLIDACISALMHTSSTAGWALLILASLLPAFRGLLVVSGLARRYACDRAVQLGAQLGSSSYRV
jgi:hypothetical protein